MSSTYEDRIQGLTTAVAVKAPARVAATADLPLSGLSTIDGVALAKGDRVLVRGQLDATENGIWVASSGDWTRAKDFDGNRDVVNGTLVLVTSGAGAGLYKVSAATAVVDIGDIAMTISPFAVASGGGSGGDVTPEEFTGSDEERLAAAFAEGISSGRPVRLDGEYSIAEPVEPVSLQTGRLVVVGNGYIKATANLGVMVSITVPYPTAVDVSSITATTRSFPGSGTTACPATKLTAAGHNLSVGDLFKLVADDQISPQSVADHRIGEFLYAADVSGNDVWVAGRLLETYSTNVRLVKVRREVGVVWDGPTFTVEPGNPTWQVTCLRVRGAAFPKIRAGFRDGYSFGLDLSSCFMAEADVHGIQMVNRAASGGSVGYLVQDQGSALSQVRISGVDARHAYTNVSATSAEDGEAYLYGRTVGSVVEGVGAACSAAAFDTHTEGYGITFRNLSTEATRYGESAAGAGVQLRGVSNRIEGGIDRNSVHGVQFFAQVSGDGVDLAVIDRSYIGAGNGIRFNTASAVNKLLRPVARGGTIRTSSNAVFARMCDQGLIEDLYILPTGSTSGLAGILLGDGADLLVRNVVFDLSLYGGSNFRAFGFDAAADAPKLHFEGCRVINAAGKFQAWVSAANTDGTVIARDYVSDAAASSGDFINAGSLDAITILGDMRPKSFNVSQLPDASVEGAGTIVWCLNGNSGSACPAISDGSAWKRIALGATVTATP